MNADPDYEISPLLHGSVHVPDSAAGRGRRKGSSPAFRSLGNPFVKRCRTAYLAGRKKLREALAAPSVTSQLMGGCANQIFQYATGLVLARRLGVDLKLDVSWFDTATPQQPRIYSLGLFAGINSQLVHSLTGQVISEDGLPFRPEVFVHAPKRCSLVGYWQCEKYFYNLRAELQERLLPREEIPEDSKITERAIAEAGKSSVFIHVRRSDYIGNANHVVLPMEYYLRGTAVVAKTLVDPMFFVFSDDVQWCIDNFKLPYPTTYVSDAHRTIGRKLGREDADLHLMRQCRHAVIANSSFSWWGAWLGADAKGGKVVAPRAWFGPTSQFDARDIVPERWMRV